MRSASETAGNGRECNTPPIISSLGYTINGNQLTINPSVNETCTYYLIDWGDGNTDVGIKVEAKSHTYSGTGSRTYLVMLYVRDNAPGNAYDSGNEKWQYITINGETTAPAKPTGLRIIE